MSIFRRQIGRRFQKRFDTDANLVQKSQVGSESNNILITADADRRARRSFRLFAANASSSPPGHAWQAPIWGTELLAPLIFEGLDNPSAIRIDMLTMGFQGQLVAAPSTSPIFQLRVNSPGTTNLNTSAPTTQVMRWQLDGGVEPDAYFNESYSLPGPIEFPINDLTKVRLNAGYSPTNPALFTLTDRIVGDTSFEAIVGNGSQIEGSFITKVHMQFSYLF